MKIKYKHVFRILSVVAFVFILLLLNSSCMTMNHRMETDMTDRGSGVVYIRHDKFSPGNITIPINTTVVWTNKDWWPHTVTSDDSLFESGKLKSGKAFSFKFTSKGTFKYHCRVHDMMTGKVIVQ